MLSAKTEYACLALLHLAVEYGSGKPVQVRRIASEGQVPEGFLVQILQQLKRVGLVTSTRGAGGGYRLAEPPESLSLAEVIDRVESPTAPASNLAEPTPHAEALCEACHRGEQARREALGVVTLADLAERASAAPAAMWYI